MKGGEGQGEGWEKGWGRKPIRRRSLANERLNRQRFAPMQSPAVLR